MNPRNFYVCIYSFREGFKKKHIFYPHLTLKKNLKKLNSFIKLSLRKVINFDIVDLTYVDRKS